MLELARLISDCLTGRETIKSVVNAMLWSIMLSCGIFSLYVQARETLLDGAR